MIEMDDMERASTMPRCMLIKQEVWHFLPISSTTFLAYYHLLMSVSFHSLYLPGLLLSWLLHPSVWEMGDLIASLLLCFDNRVQNGARIFPPMAVLAILLISL